MTLAGYVLALDSSGSCCSACYDYPFQSCSTDIPVLQTQPWITMYRSCDCLCLFKGQLVSWENWVLWEKILANFQDNMALYFNILPKDCLQTDHTIKLSLYNNLTIRFFLFIYWVIYIFIYLPINSSFLFSSSRINQCYELLRYIWVLISSFINQLFVFTFKLLGILLLRYH